MKTVLSVLLVMIGLQFRATAANPVTVIDMTQLPAVTNSTTLEDLFMMYDVDNAFAKTRKLTMGQLGDSMLSLGIVGRGVAVAPGTNVTIGTNLVGWTTVYTVNSTGGGGGSSITNSDSTTGVPLLLGDTLMRLYVTGSATISTNGTNVTINVAGGGATNAILIVDGVGTNTYLTNATLVGGTITNLDNVQQDLPYAVYLGDSMTSPSGIPGITGTWPLWLHLFFPQYTGVANRNVAVSGETVQGIVSSWYTHYLPLIVPSTNANLRPLVSLMGGFNDLRNGRTFTQLTNDYTILSALIHSNNMQLVQFTVPFPTNSSYIDRTVATNINDWIVTNTPGIFDQVVDLRPSSYIAANYSDGIHITRSYSKEVATNYANTVTINPALLRVGHGFNAGGPVYAMSSTNETVAVDSQGVVYVHPQVGTTNAAEIRWDNPDFGSHTVYLRSDRGSLSRMAFGVWYTNRAYLNEFGFGVGVVPTISYALDVVGSGHVTGALTADSAISGASFTIPSTTALRNPYANRNEWIGYTGTNVTTSDRWRIDNSGVLRMYSDANGVQFPDDPLNPAYPARVAIGTNNAAGYRLIITDGNVGIGNGTLSVESIITSGVAFSLGSVGSLRLSGSNIELVNYGVSQTNALKQANLIIEGSGVPKIHVDANQVSFLATNGYPARVAIGTNATAVAELDVFGNVNVRGSITNAGVYVGNASGLTNYQLRASNFTFTNLANVSSQPTNHVVDLAGAPYQRMLMTNTVYINHLTNGPGSVACTFLATNANQILAWPVAFIPQSPTSGLTKGASFWSVTVTNGQTLTVAFTRFIVSDPTTTTFTWGTSP